MAIADFGTNVADVQRKLNDNLPLVDAGETKAEQVLGRLEAEGPAWIDKLNDISVSCGQDSEAIGQIEAKFESLENGASRVWDEVAKQIDEFSEKTSTAIANLNSASDRIENDMKDQQEKLSQTSEEIDKDFDAVRDQARKVLDGINEIQQEFLSSRDAMFQELNNQIGVHNVADDDFDAKVAKLREQDLPVLSLRLSDGVNEFETVVADMATKADKALDTAGTDWDGSCDDFKADLQGLIPGFSKGYKEHTDKWSGHVEETIGSAKSYLYGFNNKTVDRVRDEMRETEAVAETAKEFLSKAEPLVDGVNDAKKKVDSINEKL